MNTQNSTKAISKAPVSSHPLFPAIVALWFGALFGLGSLAVRASLIESLVISSHIDVLVPMTAPPLGMTSRILLALFMAMIGIAAGAAIARRIARPKPLATARRRTATGIVSKAHERKAAAASEAQAQLAEQQIATEKAESVRRRALANGDANTSTPHRDGAPLPGGAPQILDVTQFDLAAPGSFEADLPKDLSEDAPLDLTGFAAPQPAMYQPAVDSAAEQPELAPELEPEPAVAAQIEKAAEVLESYGDDTDSFREKFANQKKPVVWAPEPPADYAPSPGDAEAHAASEAVADTPEFGSEPDNSASLSQFTPFPAEAVVELQRQPDFAMHGSDFAAPATFTDLATENPDLAAVAAAPDLRRFDGPASHTLASPVHAEVPSADVEPHASEPSPPVAATESSARPFLPQGSAAERIASAELAELSPVELIERFALALQQRRHSGAFPAGLLETAAAFGLPVRPQDQEPPAAPQAFAPLREPAAASATEAIVAAPPLFALPEAIVAIPRLFAASAPEEAEIDDSPVAAMHLPLTLPAAMRPIELGEHEEHDDLPGYVPPRSFAMPRPAEVPTALAEPVEVCAGNVQQADANLAESATDSPVEIEPAVGPEVGHEVAAGADAEADVSEDGYSSLLALSRSAPLRQTFVRIDEPDSEFAQVEPVVIFPGQSTRPGLRFSRPSEDAKPAEAQIETSPFPVPTPEGGAPQLRRFDSPGASGSATAAGPAGAQDPAEAERALRSALATLQRMSGAA